MKNYDYIIGEAARAYCSRLDEYIRSLVFIRKGDNAYIVVFDRVEGNNKKYIKKWLLHFVDEPQLNKKILSSKVKGHYEIWDSDFFSAKNAFDTARLSGKVLLPREHKVAKIGGEGFEFYVEGSRPRNWPISDEVKNRKATNFGGPWQEVGTWRIEVMPAELQKRDYFLHVLYAGEVDDPP